MWMGNKLVLVVSGLFAMTSVWVVEARPVLIEPKTDETVALVSAEQKAFLDLPLSERRRWLVETNLYARLTRAGWRPQKVQLSWTGTVGAVSVCGKKDGQTVFEQRLQDSTSVEVGNLEVAARYEWSVEDASGKAQRAFSTEDYAPRLLSVGGVPNFRDLGGRRGLQGHRVRQGLVYRSTGLNSNAKRVCRTVDELTSAAKAGWLEELLAGCIGSELEPLNVAEEVRRVTARVNAGTLCARDGERYIVASSLAKGKARLDGETRTYLTNSLAIRTDVDLRSAPECFGMEESPLGDNVRWVRHSSEAYSGVFSEKGKAAFREVFRVFLEEGNYPIVFHCISGADRTGTLAAILNGLLGVAEDDIYKDWETTAFHNTTGWFNHRERGFDRLIEGFDKFPGRTLNERIAGFVQSLGFTDADIERFRAIMLERN